MEDIQASISIFQKKVDYPDNISRPVVPKAVLEAVARVVDNKDGCELIRVRDGVYVVHYSETGPFQSELSDGWLPVYVMKLREWSSGGVTEEEFLNWNQS